MSVNNEAFFIPNGSELISSILGNEHVMYNVYLPLLFLIGWGGGGAGIPAILFIIA